MPVALILEIVNAMTTVAAGIPAVVSLGQSAAKILQTGTVTPEEEAAIRAQLDAVKQQIDSAGL